MQHRVSALAIINVANATCFFLILARQFQSISWPMSFAKLVRQPREISLFTLPAGAYTWAKEGECHVLYQTTWSASLGAMAADEPSANITANIIKCLSNHDGVFKWDRHSRFPEGSGCASRRWSAMRQANVGPLPSRISRHSGRQDGHFGTDGRGLEVDQRVVGELAAGLTSTAGAG
jgi:hypothetical protein